MWFCKRKASDEEREEGIEGGWDSDQCCQKRVLDIQEDFLAQREWLTEVVEAAGPVPITTRISKRGFQ